MKISYFRSIKNMFTDSNLRCLIQMIERIKNLAGLRRILVFVSKLLNLLLPANKEISWKLSGFSMKFFSDYYRGDWEPSYLRTHLWWSILQKKLTAESK